MKYEVILFDIDETLFDFQKTEKEALKNTFIEFNLQYEEDFHLAKYKEMNKVLWKKLEENQISLKDLKEKRFEKYLEDLSINISYEIFNKAYINNLGRGSFLLPKAQDTVKALSQNHQLAVITNGFEDVQKPRIEKSGLSEYFKEIIISESVNYSKPHPSIFEIALKNLNYFDKSKVLMVGDSLSSDIQGGINFGIDTCWYNPSNIEPKENIKANYTIKSLDELISLVK